MDEWNPLFLGQKNKSNYSKFTNKVMKFTYTIIHGFDLIIIPKEGKEWLQFTLETRVGDWFLFKDHIVIVIYGFEGQPYKFLVLLTARVLAME